MNPADEQKTTVGGEWVSVDWRWYEYRYSDLSFPRGAPVVRWFHANEIDPGKKAGWYAWQLGSSDDDYMGPFKTLAEARRVALGKQVAKKAKNIGDVNHT